MSKIKVLIVDDSAFMRKLISEFLNEDSRIEIIGIARNGKDAIRKIKQYHPDVVTMDIEMPVMDGLCALKQIMAECPVPVIMLSSSTRAGAENTLSAMENGAFDFIAKPSGMISLDLHKIKSDLIEKIVAASKANIQNLQNSTDDVEKQMLTCNGYRDKVLVRKMVPEQSPWAKEGKKIIVIGTSTGGPRALQEVLTRIPKNIESPIIIVQHMPPGFTNSLAKRLNSLCEIEVKEAEDGEIIKNGTAYIAPGGFHLKMKKNGTSLAAVLEQSEQRNGHRPSVDVLFESAGELQDYAKIAVIMTGMGSDGAKGLVSMSEKGMVKAIAESQQTSIVFGMPKAAISTNLIDSVENVENIANAIVSYC
ncbi:two-component system, chemotaxis family, response regulator CheB [Bacillus sp. OV322]|uniref:protein-glutamate methylesterase/protein-glutamine glutaminase n=1 Tax=Bacillus sp. OV322 TaxID=1882764 RepID=UPI0008EA670C|nr:chemotaxis response regulator protein-glutamate methylesterase [Bacillus sp. OV322]SFC07587.1 two-component system, chemotaxis family, response regulator CheB [Bacillus sp. OV322]